MQLRSEVAAVHTMSIFHGAEGTSVCCLAFFVFARSSFVASVSDLSFAWKYHGTYAGPESTTSSGSAPVPRLRSAPTFFVALTPLTDNCPHVFANVLCFVARNLPARRRR